MQKLQLYVNNQRVDLFKDEQVSFNQSIQNIKDPAKIFTEFTQTFTIPASKTNNILFQHYYNYDIVDGFDARDKVDALIELNKAGASKSEIQRWFQTKKTKVVWTTVHRWLEKHG